ncbi:lipoate--protein ligase [Acidaminococcus sp. DS4831]|uniref:lipoate--protein ligase n=1 Tax=Acidaminococcus sp. DS4831 TaxID=3141399 RepID=UPI0032E48811
MIYIESESLNPCFNLALEQYVFDCMDKSKEYFILWQNDNTIVVGKNQNTIAEINRKFVEEKKITVVRRLSGGGAVYHDLGNLNFTIIVSKKNNMNDFDFSRFNKPVVQALNKLGVHANISGRNDITINNKKISGNAQYIKNGRIMDHGAILYSSNLSILSKALIVSKDKIESKGIKSVRTRVTNVIDNMENKVPIEKFKKLLLEEMAGQEKIFPYKLTDNDLKIIMKIKKERYDTWEWNYGYSPKYNIEKERYIPGCGKIQIYMNVENGKISAFDIYGDYFGNKDKNDIIHFLNGIEVNREAFNNALKNINIDQYFFGLSKKEFVDILVE